MTTPEPRLSVTNQNDWELWTVRILLSIVVLGGVISLFVPGISGQLRIESSYLPPLLVGFVVFGLVFHLHLTLQRKLLSRVSTALTAATSYVDRLEQFSFIDPQTQLFNRRYLDQLFNQQLRWMNRRGCPATLLLFQVLPEDKQKPLAEEIIVDMAFVLRSNFRGSDYVVRNSGDQFLVLLPDTTEDQAEFAMNRLTNKVDDWNLENERSGLVLRRELSVCPPGGNFWDKLRELETSMCNKPNYRNGAHYFAEPQVGPVLIRPS